MVILHKMDCDILGGPDLDTPTLVGPDKDTIKNTLLGYPIKMYPNPRNHKDWYPKLKLVEVEGSLENYIKSEDRLPTLEEFIEKGVSL